MRSLKTLFLLFILIFIITISISYFTTNYLLKYKNYFKFEGVHKIVLGDSQAQCSINDKNAKDIANMALAADSYFYSYVKLRNFHEANSQLDTVYLSLAPYSITKFIENRWTSNSAHIQNRFGRYVYLYNYENFLELFNINPMAVIKSFINIPSCSIEFQYKNLKNGKRFSNLKIGGFEGLTKDQLKLEIEKQNRNISKVKTDISPIESKYLLKICDYCTNNNIELIFFHSPVHRLDYESTPIEEKSQFDAFFKNNLAEFTYLDYTKYPLPDSCFSDLVHLNVKGADIFTDLILNHQSDSGNKLINN